MALAIGSRNERKNSKMDLITKLHERMVEDTRGAKGGMSSAMRASSPLLRARSRNGGKRGGDFDGPSEWESYHEQVSWAKLKTERHKDLVLMSEDRDEPRVYHRTKGGEAMSKVKKSLAPCGLDEEFSTGVTPAANAAKLGLQDPIPLERSREAFRKREKVKELLNRRNSELDGRAGGRNGLDGSNPDGMLEGDEGPPLNIPKQQWNDIIRRTGTKEKGDKKAKTFVRKRVRHHRISCRFHPFSTSSDFRKMALTTEFPAKPMRQSLDRVQHAASGASSGTSNPIQMEEYFAPNDTMRAPTPVVGNESISTSFSKGLGGMSSAWSPSTEASPQVAPDQPTSNEQRGEDFFMTQTQSVGERCRTPSLTRFQLPPKPHSLPGEFQDCQCTPRSSDDEMGEDDEWTEHLSKLSPRAAEKALEARLLTSSNRANKKLSFWRRRFQLVTVRGLSTLNSVLDEREEQREYVVTDRSQLNLVTNGAENAGADWIISRRIRSTTPKNSSVWAKVYESCGDHDKLIHKNRETYVGLCEKAAEDFNFPSVQVELSFFDALRQRCLVCSKLPEDDERSSDFFKILNQNSRFKNIKARTSNVRSNTPSTNQKPYYDVSGLPPRPNSRATATPSQSSRPNSRLSPLPGVNRASTPLGGTSDGPQDRSSFPNCMSLKRAPDGEPLSEDFFFAVLEDFGYHFISFKLGVLWLNYLRERCNVEFKPFYTVVQDKSDAGEWQPHHEALLLYKRIMASRTGGAVGQE